MIDWLRQQPYALVLTCVGDGHDGVWNIIEALAPDCARRDLLDWFHLVENLFKLDAPAARLERWKSMLWSGLVDEVREELRELNSWQAQKLRAYLRKHRLRIVPYDLFQALGWPIGSGLVESTVKLIALGRSFREPSGLLRQFHRFSICAVLISMVFFRLPSLGLHKWDAPSSFGFSFAFCVTRDAFRAESACSC